VHLVGFIVKKKLGARFQGAMLKSKDLLSSDPSRCQVSTLKFCAGVYY